MQITLYLQGFEAATTDISDRGPLAHIAKDLIKYAAEHGRTPLPMPIDDEELVCTINIAYNYRTRYTADKMN